MPPYITRRHCHAELYFKVLSVHKNNNKQSEKVWTLSV